MSARHPNTEALLDRALEELAADRPSPEAERQAAERVWQRLAEARAAAPQPRPVEHIRSCEDYQALIPAYLAGELPEARVLLLEDHTRECIPCRRALKAARSGAPARPVARRPAERRGQVVPFGGRKVLMALAAMLLVAVGAALVLAVGELLRSNPTIAQVRSIDGTLLLLTDDGATPLAVGDSVAEGEVLRTVRGGGAVLELADGSHLELAERSEVALTERWGDHTVRVARGDVIVEAAPQRDGHLYAVTDDVLVSVTGTIFAVASGTKGSRVSVIEGEVRVAEGRQETVLAPGEQLSTGGLGSVPVTEAVAWSRDHERYAALLAELKALGDELEATLSATGLRYDSRLLDLAPAGTAVYVAAPNVSDELAAMHDIFRQRLAESELLRQWWQDTAGSSGLDAQLAELVERIQGLGEHLGEEVVLSVSLDDEGRPESPLLMAEVIHPAAFAAQLPEEVERVNAAAGKTVMVLVADPFAAPPAADEQLLLWQAGDLFAAATDADALAALATVVAQPAANPFLASPFHDRLLEAYSQGAQWLVAADVGRILPAHLGDDEAGALGFTGFDRVQHLIIERKSQGDTTHTGAVLSFDGPRHGAAAWLAEPGPMGGLDYISPDANLVAAFVVDDPVAILDQVLAFIEQNQPGITESLARIEEAYDISLRDDLAAPLGGEVALALDGPALPSPSWKVVAEVYDPERLAAAIELAVRRLGNTLVIDGEPLLAFERQEVGGRTYYRVTPRQGPFEVHFTFDDGYFLAAPSRALLDRAIAIKRSGYSLPDSPGFVAQLPQDGYLNFSALVYTDLGSLSDTLRGAGNALGLSEEQRQALDEMNLSAASLTCAYGEPDAIRLVSNREGGLFGSRLGALLGLSAQAVAAGRGD